MAFNLSNLPADILLHLTGFVPLQDAVSLAQVCTALAALAHTRTYWLATLAHTRKSTLLACPYHTDLAARTLPALRAIVHQTLRREWNWARPAPRPLANPRGYCHTVAAPGAEQNVLFVVPGTEYVVLHSQQSARVTCWDVHTGRLLCGLDVAHFIVDISGGYEERNKYTIALLSMVPLAAIFVVAVEYDPDTPCSATMTEIFRYPLADHQDYVYLGLFLYADVVGVLRADERAEIVAINTASGAAAVIETSLSIDEDGQLGSCTLDGDVYFLCDIDTGSFIHRIPRALLPYAEPAAADGHNPADDQYTVSGPFVWAADGDASPDAADPPRPVGVICAGTPASAANMATVHLHAPAPASASAPAPAHLSVRFWPIARGRLAFAPRAAVRVPGWLREHSGGAWSLLVYGHSGRVLLVAVEDTDAARVVGLRLVQYRGDAAGGATVHALEVPVDLALVTGMSIDDYRGVVYLSMVSGVLHAISYA